MIHYIDDHFEGERVRLILVKTPSLWLKYISLATGQKVICERYRNVVNPLEDTVDYVDQTDNMEYRHRFMRWCLDKTNAELGYYKVYTLCDMFCLLLDLWFALLCIATFVVLFMELFL